MFEILPIIFIIFIVWLLLRGALAFNHMRKQARKAFEQATNQYREAERNNRKGGWTEPTQRDKAIRPDEGEYVEWEEIKETHYTETTTTGNAGHRTGITEEQVSDAEWEEIDKP